MITDVDSPSASAFRTSAKNVAAQCSIIASNLQEEMESEASNAEPSTDTSTSENTTS
jgi:ATP-binding protein involved in chromosome partitioning